MISLISMGIAFASRHACFKPNYNNDCIQRLHPKKKQKKNYRYYPVF